MHRPCIDLAYVSDMSPHVCFYRFTIVDVDVYCHSILVNLGKDDEMTK